MSDAERTKLLAAHDENMSKLEATQDAEQQKSQDALQVRHMLTTCSLHVHVHVPVMICNNCITTTHFPTVQSKLEARRNKRRLAEKSKLEKNALLDDEETRRREMLQGLQQESMRKAAAAAADGTAASTTTGAGDAMTSAGPSQVMIMSCR